MRVLGIDPGSHHTGWALLEASAGRATLLAAGTLSPGGGLPLPSRLAMLHAGLAAVVRTHAPVAVAVETVFTAHNVRSALVLGQARGVALLAAGSAEVPVFEYSPAEVKRAATGNGRADKSQIQRMIAVLLGPTAPTDEHACDAAAVALCHVGRARFGGKSAPARSAAPSRRAPQSFLSRVQPAIGGRR